MGYICVIRYIYILILVLIIILILIYIYICTYTHICLPFLLVQVTHHITKPRATIVARMSSFESFWRAWAWSCTSSQSRMPQWEPHEFWGYICNNMGYNHWSIYLYVYIYMYEYIYIYMLTPLELTKTAFPLVFTSKTCFFCNLSKSAMVSEHCSIPWNKKRLLLKEHAACRLQSVLKIRCFLNTDVSLTRSHLLAKTNVWKYAIYPMKSCHPLSYFFKKQ